MQYRRPIRLIDWEVALNPDTGCGFQKYFPPEFQILALRHFVWVLSVWPTFIDHWTTEDIHHRGHREHRAVEVSTLWPLW